METDSEDGNEIKAVPLKNGRSAPTFGGLAENPETPRANPRKSLDCDGKPGRDLRDQLGTYGTSFNNLTGTVDDYVRFNHTEMDAYSVAQYAGAFSYKSTPAISPDKRSPDQAAVETVQSVFFTFHDPEFANRGKTRAALIPATGKKLKFTFRMQEQEHDRESYQAVS